MAEMKISNTLVNDTSTGEIAYAEQLKDKLIDWSSLDYNKVPASFKTDANKFQSQLNDFFLKHYNEFQTFLTEKGVDGVIDTWKDIVDFLQSISDSEAITLAKLLGDIQEASGNLNIRMSAVIPGMLEAVTRTDAALSSQSRIDEEIGAIRIVYTYE